MFVIRSEPFSFFHLLAHLGISIGLFSGALGVFAGTVKLSKAHNPFFLLVLFTMLTIVCVAAYVVVALIKLTFSNLSSERARRRWIRRTRSPSLPLRLTGRAAAAMDSQDFNPPQEPSNEKALSSERLLLVV
ncbi:hypothetical protein [Bradyrhizobium sp. USDA 4486]